MAAVTPSEPDLATEPRLLGVLEELRAREPLFHRPELGTTRADFDAQMTADFWESGASGRRYGRAFVLAMLEDRGALAATEGGYRAMSFRSDASAKFPRKK